ncbi:hypothetical protein TNCV_2197241 [Trichonephila clavipes]|nr:hypothetical protein TNCV_2197241 [Trichonephila clavipes]
MKSFSRTIPHAMRAELLTNGCRGMRLTSSYYHCCQFFQIRISAKNLWEHMGRQIRQDPQLRNLYELENRCPVALSNIPGEVSTHTLNPCQVITPWSN